MLYRRVAKSTGASVVTTLADMDGKESFDASSLGQCDEVPATQPCMLSALCTNLFYTVWLECIAFAGGAGIVLVVCQCQQCDHHH